MGIIRNDTSAYIAFGAEVNASQDVEVYALALIDAESRSIGGGGGLNPDFRARQRGQIRGGARPAPRGGGRRR